jgi:hypothetical protein
MHCLGSVQLKKSLETNQSCTKVLNEETENFINEKIASHLTCSSTISHYEK